MLPNTFDSHNTIEDISCSTSVKRPIAIVTFSRDIISAIARV